MPNRFAECEAIEPESVHRPVIAKHPSETVKRDTQLPSPTGSAGRLYVGADAYVSLGCR